MKDTEYKFFRDVKGVNSPEKEKKKKKKSFQERHEERMASMSEEDKVERLKKMKEQGMDLYEDGGVAKKKKRYFSKLKSACKK